MEDTSTYTRIVLVERPTGLIEPSRTFRIERGCSLSSLRLGQNKSESAKQGLPAAHVLVQITWLSLDPAMRGWLNDTRSYIPPVGIGEVMRAIGLGIVREVGEGSTHHVGELVRGLFGWAEYALLPDARAETIMVPPGAEPVDFLHALGTSGLTAYFGLHSVGLLKPNETLLVSGAAGAVGSLVCQLGVKAGAKVFAVAGTPEKCTWLESELGVRRAFNYKSPTFRDDLKEAGWVDVFFDNVGGEMLDLVLRRLNKGARIVICGAISEYNKAKPTGLTGYLNLISQSARMEGFIVMDYKNQYPEAIAVMSRWIADKSLKCKYHIVEGLEEAPKALLMLFNGENTGKLLVKLSDAAELKGRL